MGKSGDGVSANSERAGVVDGGHGRAEPAAKWTRNFGPLVAPRLVRTARLKASKRLSSVSNRWTAMALLKPVLWVSHSKFAVVAQYNVRLFEEPRWEILDNTRGIGNALAAEGDVSNEIARGRVTWAILQVNSSTLA